MSGIYVARLVPLGQHLPVVDRTEGAICEYFDEYAFALERKHPERVAFLLDHDPRRVAGRFHAITTSGGWLIGGFQLDDDEHGAFAAKRLKRGSPISVGFDPEITNELGQSGTLHRQVARLNEASLVDRAAYPGAQVVQKLESRQPVRRARTMAPREEPRDEVIYHQPGELLVRPGIGRVIGVR